jgi:hypothetical protein
MTSVSVLYLVSGAIMGALLTAGWYRRAHRHALTAQVAPPIEVDTKGKRGYIEVR